MQKILLVMDPSEPNQRGLDFACYVAALTQSSVTGVFLDNLAKSQIPVKLQHEVLAETGDEKEYYATMRKVIEENIEGFRQGCIDRKVAYSVHRDHGTPADEMIAESLFADLIIVHSETSFHDHFERPPTSFVQDVLKKAECPVIIAPPVFSPVEEIVFAYNRSASSLFAIKQFSYLFPRLANKKLSVVQVSETGQFEDTHRYIFLEWLKGHYTDVHFEGLKGESDEALFDCLFKRRNILLVMGAYGRTALSQFFKRSTADFLIKTIPHPIFIAHH